MNKKLEQQVKALLEEATDSFEEFISIQEEDRDPQKILVDWVESSTSDYYERLCELVGDEKAAEIDEEFLTSLEKNYC